MTIIDKSKYRGKIHKVKCLKCGIETLFSKDGNPNFNKQVDNLTSKPCDGSPRGDGRTLTGGKAEHCGGRRMHDKRIRGGM